MYVLAGTVLAHTQWRCAYAVVPKADRCQYLTLGRPVGLSSLATIQQFVGFATMFWIIRF